MTARVYIVDDDAAVRDGLGEMLSAFGYPLQAFDGGDAFLDACTADWRGCVLLDLAMPGRSGAEVHAELQRRGIAMPVIFLTGHGDIPSAVAAMKLGAFDFLQKPATGQVLRERVDAALRADAERLDGAARLATARFRYDRLSPREREVLVEVIAGRSNKEIARRLGISFRTVEVHRAHMLRKLGVQSAIELAEIAGACGLDVRTPGRTETG